MSKKSRTFQPPTTSGGTTAGAPTPATTTPVDGSAPVTPTPVTTAPATSRSAARRTAAGGGRVSAAPRSFEKYRTVIIGVIAVVLVGGAVAIVASQSSTSANAYDCSSLLTPGPTDPIPTPRAATVAPAASTIPGASSAPAASPGPQPTQKLGFMTEDMGRGHVDPTTKVDYDFCPPASGKHYNVGGRAPLPRQFYPPTTALGPGNWIHNLEHGYVVLLYRGEPTTQVQQQLQDVMAQATSSATCGYSKVIAARFDQMDPNVNFAALAWDRALLQDQFDEAALLTFANQWQDGPQTPESGLC